MNYDNNNIQDDIDNRLKKLEDLCLTLSEDLEGEKALRKEESQKCKQLYESISKQIIEIKANEPLTNPIDSMREELTNMIDSKIEENMLEYKDRIDNQYIHLKSGVEAVNKKNENVFNNLSKKLDGIEKNFNYKIKGISEELDEINKILKNLKLSNNDLNIKINDINIKLNKIERQKELDANNIKYLEKQIRDINCSKDYNTLDLNNLNDNLSYLKNEFTSLTEKYINEVEEMKIKIEKDEEMKKKELQNFESHLLCEFEHFTNCINDNFNKNFDNMKSMNECLNGDINILKNKNKYMEEKILKLRDDFFDSLNKNSQFVLDKMKTNYTSHDPCNCYSTEKIYCY